MGLAQIAPVWLDRARTLAKVIAWVEDAAARHCRLVAFGEALCPGYPFWIERTDGARFNSSTQKELHARYMDQSVRIGWGDLDPLRKAAAAHRIAVVLGCTEIPLVMNDSNSSLPTLDSTRLLARAALQRAVSAGAA